MTLQLTDEQMEALRRRAAAQQRPMEQVAVAAIDSYLGEPVSRRRRRQAVPVAELFEAFAGLPSVDADRFRADQDRHVDTEARVDPYRATA